MLKERVIDLLDRYEGCDEWLSSYDVMDELELILDEEPFNAIDEELERNLDAAICEFLLQRHEAERGGGRIDDGSDEFIESVKNAVGYED